MSGFFDKESLTKTRRSGGRGLSCVRCGLYKDALSPKIEPYGNFARGIMVIGEAPGDKEDRRGLPWQGPTGTMLRKALAKHDIDLFEDCVCLNAVNCRPPGDRTPTAKEIDCCRAVKVDPAIEHYNPGLIILVGGEAVRSVIGNRWPRSKVPGISTWRGWRIPDQDLGAWLCSIFHPSYVARVDSREVTTVWEQDIAAVAQLLRAKVPQVVEPEIQYLDGPEQLPSLNGYGITAFDYETTGLKPQDRGHRIVCASIAVGDNKVFTFPLGRRAQRKKFVEYLKDSSIDKIASNLKFEDNWSNVLFRTPVAGWVWDTMLAAHILDNRSYITGLKFQTYVNFGIIDYDHEVAPYLKSSGKSGNEMNRVQELMSTELGMRKLLKYCALDSVYEYRLAMRQMEQLNYEWLPF